MLGKEVVIVAAAAAVGSSVLAQDVFAELEDVGVAAVVDDEAQNVPVGCGTCCCCEATPSLEKLLLVLTTPP